MGACSFWEKGSGRTAREAFDALCRQAILEEGDGPYNGTISTTRLVGDPVVIAKKYSQKAALKGYGYANEHNHCNKRESMALDLGVMKYRITIAEDSNLDAEPELAVWYGAGDKLYKTQKQAERAATRIVKERGHNVSICKVYMPVGDSDIVLRIAAYGAEYEELPDDLPDGLIIEEIHMWGFYGLAAE